jgi:FkbM family methyltransferase
MRQVELGTISGALGILFNKGVRFSTVIDLGCADGHFYLAGMGLEILPGSICVNIDANPMYEGSLREIQEVIGGHYLIAAVSDSNGEVEMQMGSHAYWASLLPKSDPYWRGSHNVPSGTMKVPMVTLDALVERFALKPPFLLKLDLQGFELAALRGGANTLKQTDAVICETSYSDFSAISAFLCEHNFDLFDLTQISRLSDGTVSELYPAFLNRRLDHLRAAHPWDPSENAAVIARMEHRRQTILEQNAALLAQVRAKKHAG